MIGWSCEVIVFATTAALAGQTMVLELPVDKRANYRANRSERPLPFTHVEFNCPAEEFSCPTSFMISTNEEHG